MSAPQPDDSKRCPECKSTNLRHINTREIRAPGAGPDAPVLAKTIHVRCGRCKTSWSVTRRGAR